MISKRKYLFGPVTSRRLGKSLGIDLLPTKTCSFDCLYCECGPTIEHTNDRQKFSVLDNIKTELGNYLEKQPDLDYITFAGDGEPTLDLNLNPVISFLNKEYPHYKKALLTNGTLLSDPSLYPEILNFDLIKVSLDATSEHIFKTINQPVGNISPQNIIDGIIKLRQQYRGLLWIEAFIIPGINDTIAEMEQLAQILPLLKVNKIQLNSLDRLPAYQGVKEPSEVTMEILASHLEDSLKLRLNTDKTLINIEIISKAKAIGPKYIRKRENITRCHPTLNAKLPSPPL